ncbi:unnamed protein product [Diamesa serratosioi]
MADADMPDLSHLTPEERAIIENVMLRQKQEEDNEKELMKRKQNEVETLEQSIKQRSEQQKKAGVELDAICHICLKTRFADGIGHVCHYCSIRCCARCGGKVTLRSNKVIWVCILCRKKQELLSKTGQWINKTTSPEGIVRHGGSETRTQFLDPYDSSDKRPKLERARSAAEKENQPLQRTSSQLRRQYSQQETPTQRRASASASDSGVDDNYLQRTHIQEIGNSNISSGSGIVDVPYSNSSSQYRSNTSYQYQSNHPVDEDPRYYQGEIEGLMRTHPHLVHPRQQTYISSNQQQSHVKQQYSMQDSYGKPHKRSIGGPYLTQQRSFSSSEEELRSTPEHEAYQTSVNSPTKYYYKNNSQNSYSSTINSNNPTHSGNYYPNNRSVNETIEMDEHTLADNRQFTERRKKTVRFDGQDSDEFSRWENERQGSQDSTTKDSGIDTSSTFTSSEDSNRGDLPKNSACWQISPNGQHLIGHMLLRKNNDDEDVLGLKITSGSTSNNGAIIEKVKIGSIAEQVHLKAGDDVLKWNGISLQNKSAQEVNNIIKESRNKTLIELTVSREVNVNEKAAQKASWHQSHSPVRSQPRTYKQREHDAREKPSVLVTSPGSPEFNYLYKSHHQSSKRGSVNRFQGRSSSSITHESVISGRIQIKLGFEASTLQLILTVVCAADLTYCSNGATRNSYAKIFLLPGCSDKSIRRTKVIPGSNEPRWGQTFVFSSLRRADLNNRFIEITLLDTVRNVGEFFLGQVVIELYNHPLDDEAEWYLLQPLDPNMQEGKDHQYHNHSQQSMISGQEVLTHTDHLSPPSTTSRLSDSDTSECDVDGIIMGRDGTSISSLGSSSECDGVSSCQSLIKFKFKIPIFCHKKKKNNRLERRSRRDMSPQGRKRVAGMVSRDYQTVSGASTNVQRREEVIGGVSSNINQRSQSAAPSDNYRNERRGSISPLENSHMTSKEYPVLPLQQQQLYTPRFQSRSATATPTGSPKKRQLPKVPNASRSGVVRDKLLQEFEDRSVTRRHRGSYHRQVHHLPQYRSTGQGGWERHYSGLSDSDLTTTSSNLEPRLRPRHSLSPDKDFMGDFGDSDMESVVSVTSSAFSTQSERPRGSKGLRESVNKSERSNEPRRDLIEQKSTSLNRSLSSNNDILEDIIDGSLSDTAVGMQGLEPNRRKHLDQRSPNSETPTRDRDRFGATSSGGGGMGVKSNSTSQLSATGRKRRMGFGKKGKNSFTIHRSEEVLPGEMRVALSRGSSGASSDGEGSADGDRWSPSLRMVGDGGQLSEFIDGLGPGQLVGRQVLGAPALGDIQLSLCYQKGYLEVEVIRARGLQSRPGSKVLPAPYVKVYLVSGKKCIAKSKTTAARKTLDPLYQQTLAFREPFQGCILQVTVWGDYGRIEGKKVFMGVAQIMLDNLNLSHIVIGWYKLFGTTSLVSGPPSLGLSRRSSIASLDSLKL